MNYTVAGANIVTQWNDKSGNGRNVTATGTITNTGSINGVPATNWASDAYFSGSASNTGTTVSVFCVLNMNSSTTGSDGRVVSLGTLGSYDFDRGGSAIPILRRSGKIIGAFRNYAELSRSSNVTDVALLAGSIFTGSSNIFYANGTASAAVATSGNFTYSNHVIGANSWAAGDAGGFFRGTIGEVIIYNAALTDAERQRVEGYLAWKWRLTGGYLPSFTPTQIPGCSWWLDGADPLGTGTPPSTNTTLGTWYDKSGNSRNASGGGGATYVSGGVAFNGSSHFYTMSVPYSSNYSIFLVATNTSVSQCYYFARSAVGANHPTFIQGYIGAGIGLEWYEGNDRATIATTPSSPFLASVDHIQGSTIVGYYFGTQAFSIPQTAGYNSSPWDYLGKTGINAGWYGGTMKEILIFSNVLTTAQRQQVEGYLASKWGFSSSLPASNPYRNIYLPSTHPYRVIKP